MPTDKGKAGAALKVWDPTMNGESVMTAGNFIPQIWLGNEFRGLLWYADNDKGWTPTDGRNSQEVDREGDSIIMVQHLINVPTRIDSPRTIRFVIQPTPVRPLMAGWRMLNTSFSQSFLPWSRMGRDDAAYSAMINLKDDAAYAKSLEFSKTWKAYKAEPSNIEMYFAPHTESSDIMTTDWPARTYFGGEWEGGTYTKSLNDHTLWYVNKWIEKGGLQGLYHDQFAPHKISSASSGLAYLLPDGRVQPGFALTTRRDYVMRQHALWMEKGIKPPRTLVHSTNGGPMGSYGWIESVVDGEDKQINKDIPMDFADMWNSDRIRAGSIPYNLGATYVWMRLFDAKGFSEEQVKNHLRTYIGHCMMHDVMNPFGIDPNTKRTPALLSWGMNNDKVFFWPFWSNGDVVKGQDKDIKVSAWTLPDRVLLCVFNYSKEKPADVSITVDLKKMGVTLPSAAKATDLEKKENAVAWDAGKGECKVTVGKRDYMLIGISTE